MTSRTKPAGRRAQRTGPKTLGGSPEAKRTAAVLLEVLSGVRGPQEGAEALATSLSRYYLLETRGLQGLIAALEPRPKGRQRSAEAELAQLSRDKRRLEQELGRSQALLRAAQRSLGLAGAARSSKKPGKLDASKPGRRRRRRVVRAVKAVAALREASVGAAAVATDRAGGNEHGGRTASTGSGTRGAARGSGGSEASAARGARDADG